MAAVVLGAGVVGEAVADALSRLGPVAVLARRTHPVLAAPGPEAAALVRATIAGVGARCVVDAVGRLTGSEDELDAANHRWAAWIAGEVLTGSGVRLVHLGSAAEYGDPGSAHPVEEGRRPAPVSAYGRTKWAGSRAVLAARAAGLDAVVARVFNLAGPDLAPGSPLDDVRAAVLALGPRGGVVEVGDPDVVRDVVHVDDAAAAVAALATGVPPPPIVNVCTGVGLRLGAVVEAMGRRRGLPVEVRSKGWEGIAAVVGDPGLLATATGLRLHQSADAVAAACLPEAAAPAP